MIHMRRKCILACLVAAMTIQMGSAALAETCTVTANKLMLRQEANSDSKALQTLPQGTKLEIIQKEGNWYKVSYGKFVGYVYGEYVDMGDTVPEDKEVLQKGDKGPEVKAVQLRLKELGYYKATCDSSFGNVTVTAVKAFQKKNGLTQDGVVGTTTLKKLNSDSAIPANGKPVKEEEEDNKKEEAGKKEEDKDDGKLKIGSKGDAVKKVQARLKELGYYTNSCDGDFGGRTEEAVKAFQKKNGLTADGIVGEATMKKLNDDAAINEQGITGVLLKSSQTLKPGKSSEQVKALQKKLKELGYYNSVLDSDYGDRTEDAVREFQRANGLTVNGIANSTTIKKMLSSSAVTKGEADKKNEEDEKKEEVQKPSENKPEEKPENDKPATGTESLDWFKNGKSVFAGRPVIQIKDVRTGLVFKAKVLYGSNHLDVEPLTKEDTAILLKINGGVEFSWRRRPMLVKHNGHVYAASIYSVPHGEQSILDNNFDGQFCLHFSGSKTHGSDEVKDDHQSCVNEALKATW